MAIAAANTNKNREGFQKRHIKCWIVILFAALATIATLLTAGCKAKLSGPISLAPPFSRFLQGGGSYAVSVNCHPGEGILVRVAQDNIDVTLTLADGVGTDTVKVDSPSGRFGDEFLVFTCGPQSHHNILIQSQAKSDPGGTIGVALYSLSRATNSLTAAFRHMSDAGRKNVVRGEGVWAKVLSDLSAAAESWKNIGMQREYALSEFDIAYVHYMDLTEWRDAARHAGLAARAFAAIDDAAGKAAALQLQGAALEEAAAAMAGNASDTEKQHTFEASEALLQSAEKEQRTQGRLFDAAMSRDYLALNYYYQGREDAAMSEFELTERDFASLKEDTARGMVLQNMATINYENGSYAKAKSAFETLLPLMVKQDDPYLYATVLHNSALVLSVTGDLQKALERELESLEIHKVRNSRSGQARSLYAIGIAYQRLGDYDRALEYLKSALVLERQEVTASSTDQSRLVNQRGQMFAILVGIGNVERALHHYDSALNVHVEARALAVSEKSLARIELALGLDHAAKGQFDRALREFERALQRGAPDTNPYYVEIVVARSQALRGIGEPAVGLALVSEAARVAVANDNLREQAMLSAELASLKAGLGDKDEALKELVHAISLSERLRSDARSPELRATTTASQRDLYRQWVNLLLVGGHALTDRGPPQASVMEALSVADRSHSRALRERLRDEAVTSGPARTGDALTTFDELAGKRATLDSLLERDHVDPQRVGKLREEIALLHAKADLVNQQQGMDGPIGEGSLIEASGTQALLRDRLTGCALVEYLVTADSSWAWVVTGSDQVAVFRLPSESKINSLVQNLLRSLQATSATASWQDATDALANTVLKPALAGRTSDCLVIVPDGELHYVPFSLLASHLQANRDHPVAVSIAPSLQMLKASRAQDEMSAAKSRVVIFTPQSRSADTATAQPGLQALDSEVRAIQTAFGTEDTYVATPMEATREGIMHFDFSKFSVVHIATHGRVDSSNGSLSRLSFGNQNDACADLRAYDVSRLHLSSSLVVLSACDSGLGQLIDGEGLVGFVHAFIGAGAQSVLMSLWKVPDEATAQLMAAFYAALKHGRVSPGEALSIAQREMANSSRWGQPYYWAGFELFSTRLPNIASDRPN